MPFLRSIQLLREEVGDFSAYPFSIPAIRTLETLELDPQVTFLVGENGSGKSTLVEALAVAAGFNPEGGSTNFNFQTRGSHSELYERIRLVRGTSRPRTGFFLRAESFFNVASTVDQLAKEEGPPLLAAYGGRSLHEQSHGESFLALVNARFGPHGLYVLDEPEAALSIPGSLALLRRMRQLTAEGSQFVVATHSPILMGYPGGLIYQLTDEGFERIAYEDTDHYQLTRSFLEDRERFFRHLFSD
jgi:predicted ATPase